MMIIGTIQDNFILFDKHSVIFGLYNILWRFMERSSATGEWVHCKCMVFLI
jgi:hypothetical protein